MKTINDYIHNGAQQTPNQLAVVTPNGEITYRDFELAINRRALEFEQSGLQPNQGYVYRTSQDIDFLITYFALKEFGAVAVPLEQSIPEEAFQALKAEVDGYEFAPEIDDLLFTSGSTGKAKGVMLSTTALTTCAENFIHDNYYTSDIVYIISGPLNHIASLFKIHPTLMAGGTVCVVDGLKDMNALFDVFDKMPDRRFAFFLVPASIRLLLQFSRDQLVSHASQIDFIETGTAPLTKNDMQELSSALPNARLYNSLGGTEIGAVSTYNFNDGKYMVGCVGKPMLHSTITINDEGTIQIQAPTLMSGYFKDPEATARVLKDGVFTSSDRGYFDEEGNLFLLGRNDNAINVGGFKADPIEIENTICLMGEIKDCLCIEAPHPIAGSCIKLLYMVRDGASVTPRDIAKFLKTKLESYKIPMLYETVDYIQLKQNGKKDRQYYKNK